MNIPRLGAYALLLYTAAFGCSEKVAPTQQPIVTQNSVPVLEYVARNGSRFNKIVEREFSPVEGFYPSAGEFYLRDSDDGDQVRMKGDDFRRLDDGTWGGTKYIFSQTAIFDSLNKGRYLPGLYSNLRPGRVYRIPDFNKDGKINGADCGQVGNLVLEGARYKNGRLAWKDIHFEELDHKDSTGSNTAQGR